VRTLTPTAQTAMQPAMAMAAALRHYDASGAVPQFSGINDSKPDMLRQPQLFFGLPRR